MNLKKLLVEWEDEAKELDRGKRPTEKAAAAARRVCAMRLGEALPLQYSMAQAPPPVPGRYLVWAQHTDYADGWAWSVDDWDGKDFAYTDGVTHWSELPEDPR